MLFRLIILFAAIPLMELYLLLAVGQRLGPVWTIALVLATAALGAYLSKSQGLRTIERMRENMSRGVAPAGELVSGALILLAGVLLLTPGFLTDAVGFCLLIPPLRQRIIRLVQRKLVERTTRTYIDIDHHS
ncbi:FxsA family protein [Desulfocurvibacter africanus]|uniref:FxsA cytoplasmic membrane protein n=1 Tax=Desulfocurvibacter africanus subsp. africanus str. Walvis Bay TaxID=690850 RepID=F3Z059_DESAF|nr:FxsA family protein [Desulfocurvibacter africanus]EGJ49761.1 FxsA cytoplasmic membrane protein [Desulfocurvibacter africanus subsp. africanus str. Walvis Bay]